MGWSGAVGSEAGEGTEVDVAEYSSCDVPCVGCDGEACGIFDEGYDDVGELAGVVEDSAG